MATTTTFSEKMYSDLQKKLDNSPTAYTPGVTPTKQDINDQIKLMSLDASKRQADSNQAKEDWYGENTPDSESDGKEGLFSKALNLLSTPLYGVAGVAELAVGTNTEDGLANIGANIKERGTFGDILRAKGVPQGGALPLGLALDIAFDPVNWATMGTAAVIPRIAKGLTATKAGSAAPLAGVKAAVESSALSKKAGAMKFVPSKMRSKNYENVVEKSMEANKKYDALVGKGENAFNEAMDKKAVTPTMFDKAFDWLEKKIPGIKAFGMYDPQGNLLEHKLDALANPVVLDDFGRTIIDPKKKNSGLSFMERVESNEKIANGADPILAKVTTQTKNILNGTSKSRANGGEEVVSNLTQLSPELDAVSDAARKVAKPLIDETGVGWYDDMVKKVRADKNAMVNKTLNTYGVMIGLFKNVKTSGNPGAYVLATIGNTVMTKMAGLNADADFIKSVYNARKVATGKAASKEFVDFMNRPEFATAMKKYPKLFQGLYGVDKYKVSSQEALARALNGSREKIAKLKNKNGKFLSEAEQTKLTDDMMDRFREFEEEARNITATQLARGGYANGVELIDNVPTIIRDGEPREMTGIVQDIYSSPYVDFLDGLENSKSGIMRGLHTYLTKSSDLYETVDQSFKLGITFKLSKSGISKNELTLLSRSSKISSKDYGHYVEDAADGIKKFKSGAPDPKTGAYHLTVDKSMDVAAEIYMNYMAMPNFVKRIRQVPLVGAPFASFSYAMMGKTAKTLAYNPAVFNKVNFALKEVSGEKSPLEKLALKEPYYERFEDPGMVKLNFPPFFQDNPVYMNMENMLPYYTLNMFQPSQRKYDEKYPAALSDFINKFPALKDPFGSIIIDYGLFPMMLQDEAPKGMFNQPLYPESASTLAKTVGYPARQASEAFIPPFVGALAGMVLPAGFSEYYPSYQARRMANAKEGLTPIGVEGKESKVSRTLRAISGTLSVPVYPLDTGYVSYKAKNNQ